MKKYILQEWESGIIEVFTIKVVRCRYIDICESGCSMTSLAINGAHKTKDPLLKVPYLKNIIMLITKKN